MRKIRAMSKQKRFKRTMQKATTDQIAAEYNLICQKKSVLSKAQRELVIIEITALVKKGVLSYKTKGDVKQTKKT